MFHKQFAEWYRIANLTFTAEDLEKRSEGIELIAKEFTENRLPNIIRLSRGEYVAPAEAEEVTDSFARFDSTFPRRDNAVEMQILAGSVIVFLLEGSPSTKSDVAALASISADYFGRRRRVLVLDFIEHAQRYLLREGDRMRQLQDVPSARAPLLKTTIETEIKPAKEAMASQGVSAATISALVDTLVSDANQQRASTSELLSSVTRANSGLSGNQKILQEEVNILWWLLGETSRDLDQRVSTLKLPAAALIVGKELADLTTFHTGPVSARPLLGKMLSIGRKKLNDVSLRDAINSAPRVWREKWAPSAGTDFADLCPARLACLKSLETNGQDDWLPAFVKAAGDAADAALPAAELAYQVYLECLLARLF